MITSIKLVTLKLPFDNKTLQIMNMAVVGAKTNSASPGTEFAIKRLT